jgi:hypothetical protein
MEQQDSNQQPTGDRIGHREHFESRVTSRDNLEVEYLTALMRIDAKGLGATNAGELRKRSAR